MKVRKSGDKDSGGELEVDPPTILSTRAGAGITSVF